MIKLGEHDFNLKKTSNDRSNASCFASDQCHAKG